MKTLIDTNILLRFFDLADPRNAEIAAAIDALTSATAETYVCAQVLIEYWVAATRPREVNGFGLDPEEADLRIGQIETLFVCLPEPPDMARRWRELATQYRALGKNAHDARIAALMLANGVEGILTLNASDFARYEGITPVSPSDVLAG
jgi:predicted nucleic acid-binding protein